MSKERKSGIALEALEVYERSDGNHVVLFIEGEEVIETPAAIRLLGVLLAHSGKMLRRDDLIERLAISGKKPHQTLNEYMYRLRRLLRTHHVQGEIGTAAEIGYMLCPFA